MDKLSKKELKEQYKNRAIIGGVYCIQCQGNSNIWIRGVTDMQGSKNRYAFSIANHVCPEANMLKEWEQYGPSSFSFEVLEELQKKEAQTDHEFAADIKTLREMWIEKTNSERQEKRNDKN